MDNKFKKLLLLIIVSTCIVFAGIVFRFLELPYSNLIFNIGIALEIIFGGYILIYLLKHKNK